jgi:hypothetical protein
LSAAITIPVPNIVGLQTPLQIDIPSIVSFREDTSKPFILKAFTKTVRSLGSNVLLVKANCAPKGKNVLLPI